MDPVSLEQPGDNEQPVAAGKVRRRHRNQVIYGVNNFD